MKNSKNNPNLKELRYSFCSANDRLFKQNHLLLNRPGTNQWFPLVFFQKPKWVTNEDAWYKLCESVTLTASPEVFLEVLKDLEGGVI